jgi:hypothetical protein
MKISQLIILFLYSITYAQEHHKVVTQDKLSTHGMLIFGKEKIYASHLPMFHSPHDYQIILELELDKETRKFFVTDQEKNPEYNTYTIEPEKFVLPDMIHNPKPFKANLYRGHFERGGKKIVSDINVTIRTVIYYDKFNVNKTKSTTNTFILFGNEKEKFIAHQITNKPDFDQIIQVKTDVKPLLNNKNQDQIIVNKIENYPIGVGGNDIEVTNNSNSFTITLLKQLYLEFDDLK